MGDGATLGEARIVTSTEHGRSGTMGKKRTRVANDLARYDDVNIEVYRLRLLGLTDPAIAKRLSLSTRQIPAAARRGEALVQHVQEGDVLDARRRAIARHEYLMSQHFANHTLLRDRIGEGVGDAEPDPAKPPPLPLLAHDLVELVNADTKVLQAIGAEGAAIEGLQGAAPSRGEQGTPAITNNILIALPSGEQVPIAALSGPDLDAAILALEAGEDVIEGEFTPE